MIDYRNLKRLQDKEAFLTVIIPIRLQKDTEYYIERLGYVNCDNKRPSNIDILVIDDGSEKNYSKEIEKECSNNNYYYYRIDTELEDFNISRSRNVGGVLANSKYIMFLDIDIMVYPNFFLDITNEINIQFRKKYENDLIVIGVLYLTKEGTEEYIKTRESIKKSLFISYLLDYDKRKFTHDAPVSSINIMSRLYFLQIGGFNESFNKWGLEDSEFAVRLIHDSNKYKLPKNFPLLVTKDYSDQVDYNGWRSLYRLWGEVTSLKGIYLFHGYHTISDTHRNEITRKRNLDIYRSSVKKYLKEGHYLDSLPNIYREKTLYFNKNPHSYNRSTLPLFGPDYILDINKNTSDEIISYINKNDIKIVIFNNPYGSDKINKIFNIIKELGVNYYIVERGGLPNTLFFDKSGFNSNALTADIKEWDKEISDKDKNFVVEYIKNEKSNCNSLESQPDMLEGKELVQRLNIEVHKKIIFVPFQTRGDTVIKYFSGDIKNYNNFISLIRQLAEKHGDEVIILIKNHPLSKDKIQVENTINVDSYHIKSVLSITDYVLLINSGVGVLAMSYNIPVMYCGKVFYSHDDINISVNNINDIMNVITKGFTLSEEKVIRFYKFLLVNYYSKVKFHAERKDWSDEQWMTVSPKVDYINVNINNETRKFRMKGEEIDFKSKIFDCYRLSVYTDRNNKSYTYNSITKTGKFIQNIGITLFYLVSYPFMNKNQSIKLKNTPLKFFQDSNSYYAISIGKILFPQLISKTILKNNRK